MVLIPAESGTIWKLGSQWWPSHSPAPPDCLICTLSFELSHLTSASRQVFAIDCKSHPVPDQVLPPAGHKFYVGKLQLICTGLAFRRPQAYPRARTYQVALCRRRIRIARSFAISSLMS
jgi:hypothetical protein